MEQVGSDIAALKALITEARAFLLGLGISAARMIGMIAIVPIMKRTELGRILVAIYALSMSLPISAGIGPNFEALQLELDLSLAILVAKEVLVGAFIGVLFSVPFWAVNVAGDLIDTQRSIGQSGLDDPISKEQISVMSSLLVLAVITMFVSNGGLQIIVASVYDSYAIWPLDRYAPTFNTVSRDAVLVLMGNLIWLGVVVAGPFVAMFLISDFALAGLSRLAGRIELVSMLPLIKNLLFCGLLLVYVTYLMEHLTAGLFDRRDVLDALRLFSGPP